MINIMLILITKFFAIKSKIKNIVILINLKAKSFTAKVRRCFSKVLSRFNEIFRSKKFKN